MLYFAYGSNLDWEQMKKRCPSARFLCVARLAGHKLAFTRLSDRRQCGTADVVQARGSDVWGVVYRLDECDFGPLDEYEGCVLGRANNAYDRIEAQVLQNGDEARGTTAWIYVVNAKSEREHVPNVEYKRLMTDGARHWVCQKRTSRCSTRSRPPDGHRAAVSSSAFICWSRSRLGRRGNRMLNSAAAAASIRERVTSSIMCIRSRYAAL